MICIICCTKKLLYLFLNYESASDLLGKLNVSKTMQLNLTPNTQSRSDVKFSFFESSKCFSKDRFVDFPSNRNLLTNFYLLLYQLLLDLFDNQKVSKSEIFHEEIQSFLPFNFPFIFRSHAKFRFPSNRFCSKI